MRAKKRQTQEELEELLDEMSPQANVPMTVTKPVLENAHSLIYGDREADYGPPGRNLRIIANYWRNYLRSRGLLREDNAACLEYYDVCRMMELLKLARLGHNPDARDSSIDICGYEALIDRVKREDHA